MTREDEWLAAINGALTGESPMPEVPGVPVWIYEALCGVFDPKPFPARTWRLDEFLYAVYCAVNGDTSVEPPEPTCRIEEFWRGVYKGFIGDNTATVPAPAWTTEDLLRIMHEAAAVWGTSEETLSGSVVSFTGKPSTKITDLVVTLAPIQAGSGTPSPDNPRAISGLTGVNVPRIGKNVFSTSLVHGVWATGTFWSHEGASSKYLSSLDIIPVKSGQTYVLSYVDDPNNTVQMSSYSFYSGASYVDIMATSSKIVTIPSGIDGMTFNLVAATAFTSIANISTRDVQLELGSTATAYDPYSGEVISVDWTDEAGTVYGGTLGLVTGVLTVDRAMDTINGTQNLVDNGVQAYGGISCVYTPTKVKKRAPSVSTQNEGLVSNLFDTSNAYVDGACAATGRSTNGYIYFNMPVDITTVADAKTWFASHPTQISYLLETPLTYQLAAADVRALVGDNYVWSDFGDVTVTVKGAVSP